MSIRLSAWWVAALAALFVAAPRLLAQADEDDSDNTVVTAGAMAQPKSLDSRWAQGPKPGRLAPPDTAPQTVPPGLARRDGKPFTCTAMGLVDIATGQILFGRNLTQKMQPASCTKILTALLAMEDVAAGRAKWSDLVLISKEAATTGESSLWLQVGERMSLHDLLVGVMVRSANDASRAVAEHLGGGSAAAFMKRMNQRAAELGAVNTHYINPHGLHMDLAGNESAGDNHWTTPYDLLLFTMTAWQYPYFRQLCLMDGERVSWEQMPPDPAKTDPKKPPAKHPDQRLVPNRNKLLHRYGECVGVKTGFTKQAGACLVSAALRDGRAVMAVTMHSASGEDRWQEAEALLRYGLDNYRDVTLVKPGERVKDVPVSGGTVATVPAVTREGLTLVWPKAAPTPEPTVSLQSSLEAPLPEGLPVGTMIYHLPGGEVRQVGLTAGAEVPRAGWLLGPWAWWLLWALTGAGVLCYGAIAEAHCRGRHLFAAGRRGTDPRWSGAGQWASRPGTGYEGLADGSD